MLGHRTSPWQLCISTSPPDSGGERSLACYQHSVQSPSSLMVWGCISDYGIGSLHIGKVPSLLKGIYTGCRATHAQHMQHPDNVFFGQSLAYFNKKMINCRMLKWPAWSPDLPLTQRIWCKTLTRLRTIKQVLYQTWLGQYCSPNIYIQYI